MESSQKLRVLCLHGFRTSSVIFQQQMAMARWDKEFFDLLDMVFLDAPFPASGKSDVEGYFDPPYFEWWSAKPDYREYRGFEDSVAFVSDYMAMHGPFDGLMGFSQGGILASLLTAMQLKGQALQNVPRVRFVMVVGASTPRVESLQQVLAEPVACPSLHLIGAKDFLRERGEKLQQCFQTPVVIQHARGHVVPRLDQLQVAMFRGFLALRKVSTSSRQ